MATTGVQSIQLLGADHVEYGRLQVERSASGHSACAISVGAAAKSPSRHAKGGADSQNEDALLLLEDDGAALLAIADAHYGFEASNHLICELARLVRSIPADPAELEGCLRRIEAGTANRLSASTLLVVVHSVESGQGFGINYGDSSLYVVDVARARVLSPHNPSFLAPADVDGMRLDEGSRFEFDCEPGDLLVACSDGVNECHYGSPLTSIGPTHLVELRRRWADDPTNFAQDLGELALSGVDGNPGGQDNIALIVRRGLV